MYVCMYVCKACMYVYTYVKHVGCKYENMNVLYVCMYVWSGLNYLQLLWRPGAREKAAACWSPSASPGTIGLGRRFAAEGAAGWCSIHSGSRPSEPLSLSPTVRQTRATCNQHIHTYIYTYIYITM